MPTKKLVCPSCSVGLKVADTLPAGKKIKCPKCAAVFAVPAKIESPQAAIAATPRPRKVVPPPVADDERADDEHLDNEVDERPARRKGKKKRKKKANPLPMIIGGVVAVIAVGVTLAIVFWPSSTKSGAAAQNSPSTQPSRGRDSENDATPAGGESPNFAAGKKVFDTSGCTKCHSIGGGGGGGFKGKLRGPDLGKVGADPSHTSDWLADYVRNPKAQRPNSKMPPFEGKINGDDLRSLGEYLASLK